MNRWLALVATFAPTILALFGVKPIVGQLVVDGIATEEAARGAGTGAEKKAAVLTGVQAGVQALNDSRSAEGKPPLADPAALAGQVGGAIDLVVTVVNAVHAKAPDVPAATLGTIPTGQQPGAA